MNCCVLIMYNGVPVSAILIMRSSPMGGRFALMMKSRLRYLQGGNGQDLDLFLPTIQGKHLMEHRRWVPFSDILQPQISIGIDSNLLKLEKCISLILRLINVP